MITTEELIKGFQEITDRMNSTMQKKNKDYSRGEDPFKNLRRHGTYGIVVRLDDKLCRLDSLTNPRFADHQPANADESLEDTAIDIAVYSLLLILLHREEK
jgi:hypothetical protein